MEETDLHLHRKARDWAGTMIVSIPAESVRQLEIEHGQTLEVGIKKP